jgi:hypothetical protein
MHIIILWELDGYIYSSRQMETYGILMNTIRRDIWIRMGDRLRYMGADGNIEAQREHECPEGNK